MAVKESSCLFCQIIEKTIPAKIVSEEKTVLAIEDVHPQAPVHLLVMPKVHVETIMDLSSRPGDLWNEMLSMVQRVARDRGIEKPGFRTVVNCNADAGQTVFHLHMHVLGGRRLTWPPG